MLIRSATVLSATEKSLKMFTELFWTFIHSDVGSRASLFQRDRSSSEQLRRELLVWLAKRSVWIYIPLLCGMSR